MKNSTADILESIRRAIPLSKYIELNKQFLYNIQRMQNDRKSKIAI